MGLNGRYLLNDMSLKGVCTGEVQSFQVLKNVFAYHRLLKAEGSGLEVSRYFTRTLLKDGLTVRDAIFRLPQDQRRSILLWIDHEGPFWDSPSIHTDNDYFLFEEEIVTQSGLAEAAMLRYHGELCNSISISPGKFEGNPLVIRWLERKGPDLEIHLPNYSHLGTLQEYIRNHQSALGSWNELLRWCASECSNLRLNSKVEEQLGLQFHRAAAEQIKVLLSTLDQIVAARRESRQRDFLVLQQQWMVGKCARFSDSSDNEKRDFASELRFIDPLTGRSCLCYWHGKVKTPQMRIHFEWPPLDFEPLFVGYVGPKISKR